MSLGSRGEGRRMFTMQSAHCQLAGVYRVSSSAIVVTSVTSNTVSRWSKAWRKREKNVLER